MVLLRNGITNVEILLGTSVKNKIDIIYFTVYIGAYQNALVSVRYILLPVLRLGFESVTIVVVAIVVDDEIRMVEGSSEIAAVTCKGINTIFC